MSASRVRIAELAPCVPAHRLWQANHHLYDALLDAKLTWRQYQWFNRHISFSSFDPNAAAPGEDGFDRFRKRREVIELVNDIIRSEYNPHQYLGMDDGSRSHKHRGRKRIRFKTGVHCASCRSRSRAPHGSSRRLTGWS